MEDFNLKNPFLLINKRILLFSRLDSLDISDAINSSQLFKDSAVILNRELQKRISLNLRKTVTKSNIWLIRNALCFRNLNPCSAK